MSLKRAIKEYWAYAVIIIIVIVLAYIFTKGG